MITKVLKAEIVEAYDGAFKALQSAARNLEEVAMLVEIADRDSRLANRRMLDDLGNVTAELGVIRRRLGEVETYEDRRKEK
ncbi:hypothetical protein [Amycolatopsis orientalis]|uniref:hypothetical protein n=1 Tax=Amycolatopsis orientalis TaxID=31958 RepID=UPI00055D843D|nr:hypothetical protein [Amycolatopsis orientalis]